MKQLLQNMRDGKAVIEDVPTPEPRKGTALVKTAVSLVSAGTERMVVEFAEKNLVDKARSRPDLVRQVLDKAQREGLIPTIQATFNRLDQPMALGYSSAGTIVKLGEDMGNFKVGDRVACAGGGYAVHAEYGIVPKNLLIPLPGNVDFESAAFTTLGAIALQGFRLANPQIGENIAIIGLGLLGLLTLDIARAAGCNVFGVDINKERVEMARESGCEAVLRKGAEDFAASYTDGKGFDSVLICADTSSNDAVEFAGEIARDKGKVIAVGAVGLNIPRKTYYNKEIEFIVSRSYGPGRYDTHYEEEGQDYPYGYVRWTEGRNMQAVVNLIASDKINARRLISHRYPIEQGTRAYELITGKIKQPFLGVVITYKQDLEEAKTRVYTSPKEIKKSENKITIGVLGSGNYAKAVFLPAIKKVGLADRVGIVSASGLNARHSADRFGFEFASSSEDEVIDHEKINTLVLLTRHQDHARQVIKALNKGKNVYCEKPLALNEEELKNIQSALQANPTAKLMVGYNRRFASLAEKLKSFISPQSEPIFAHYRVNAGFLPLNHWLHDLQIGGGRIIGEGCHFIDFLTFLIGSAPLTVSAVKLPDKGKYKDDNVQLTFTYADGSIGTLSYLANGDKSLAKERLEVFCGGKVAILDDYRRLELVKNGRHSAYQTRFTQDKGHQNSWRTFLNSILNNSAPPVPYSQLFGISLATFRAMDSLKLSETVHINYLDFSAWGNPEEK